MLCGEHIDCALHMEYSIFEVKFQLHDLTFIEGYMRVINVSSSSLSFY